MKLPISTTAKAILARRVRRFGFEVLEEDPEWKEAVRKVLDDPDLARSQGLTDEELKNLRKRRNGDEPAG